MSLQFVHIDEIPFYLDFFYVVRNLDIQLSEVCSALSACDASADDVSCAHIEVMLQIEDSLLPVRKLFIWTRAQKDRPSQIAEWSVEPRNQTMNSISILHLETVLT